MSLGELIWKHTVQEMVPRAQLGRVSSVDLLGSWAMLPVGYAIIGVATQHLGAGHVFELCGAITTVVCLLALLHPTVRATD